MYTFNLLIGLDHTNAPTWFRARKMTSLPSISSTMLSEGGCRVLLRYVLEYLASALGAPAAYVDCRWISSRSAGPIASTSPDFSLKSAVSVAAALGSSRSRLKGILICYST